MQPWKRALVFLLLNAIVSATVTLTVLWIWDLTHPKPPVAADLPSRAELTPVSGPVSSPASPTATSAIVMEEYLVREGDTLGQIAEKYQVSVESLLRANGLQDANALSVGMVIYIPVTPEAPLQSPAQVTPSPLAATPTLAPGARPPGAVINSVIGVGDLSTERVFITRVGSGVLLLKDWRLTDEDGNVFVFPELALYEDGAINLWTTTGIVTPVDLYWGLATPVWRAGETAALYNERGEMVSTYTIP
ncbi:MAG: LysM peptidoglycan-binding domain-containing protein [Anaerolineales bacterium]|nr:LysM peptidoglycan-binding domain-containing protein [Anaerolineales bacterium]MCS7248838.1 LysM peptidoglycan-binding domain-containing protein [Anaerolineales bacterium]MDW8162651.1 LysM peptidoglycan-binding domain-containing protein [Anaerolineales bacterium]MDW8448320.1 LysM peptidoglycan-binding domain-containing protein [Anaerolineales bacterium]